METKTVTVKFGGDINGVSVDTFTQVVLGYARILQASAEETNPNVKLDIKITATHPGCLEAVLETVVGSLPALLATLSQTSEQLLPIIKNANAFLELRRFLARNGAPKAIERNGDGISITAGNNANITINQTVYKLGTSNAADAAASSMFSALESDESIEGVSVKSDSVKDFEVPAAEFSSVKSAPSCAIGDERVVPVPHVYLSVTKPMLEVSDKRKWEFYWNGQRCTGFVSDFDFLNKLVSHEYTFGIGDDILADLELTQHKNETNVWENKKIRVVRVYDVIAQSEPPKLF